MACSALSLPALANEECGTATTGKVTCMPTGTPLPQVRYEGVEDFEVVLGSGVEVDGSALPEGETAVVVYGNGTITLTAEDGTLITAYGAWPAVDVVSTDGPVSVKLDAVLGSVHAASGGDVNLTANLVDGGIDAQSFGGNITVDVTDTVTVGPGGTGIHGYATDGNVNIGANRVFTAGDFSTGILGISDHGDVVIDNNFVRAEGLFAHGIVGQSLGGDVWIATNTTTVEGEGSGAIIGFAVDGDVHVDAGYVSKGGNFGVGIAAFSVNGSGFVSADTVSTFGDYARAIDVQVDGDATVNANYLSTNGSGSDGLNIEAAGAANVDIGRIATFGSDSYGVRIIANEDVNVKLSNATIFGPGSAALYATAGFDGDINAYVKDIWTYDTTNEWFAVGLNTQDGDVNALMEGTVNAASGYAITTSSLTGRSYVKVAQGANVYGGTTALDSAAGGGARFAILGTVDSGNGPVIRVQGSQIAAGAADVRIGETGKVHGYMQLTDSNDVVSNAGTWRADGISQFGAGNDRVSNAGAVALDGAATSMTFSGLERFENAGRIDLVNGRTEDLFRTDGALHGAGGTIGVDLDLATGKSDTIHAGSFSGVSVLDLDLVGRGSALGLSDVRVAISDSAQNGGELMLSDRSRNKGFVGFSLRWDGADSWVLESDLADQAYLAGAVPAGVRDLWRQGVQSVSSHLVTTHDDEDTNGLWIQYVGGDLDGTSKLSHSLGARELEWTGSHKGVQAGLELAFGNWRTGVTGGIADASMDLGGTEETRLDTMNVGLYAQYFGDGWFATGIVRGERVDVESRWGSIGLNAQGDGSTVGVSLEGGYRFDLDKFYIEPHARLSWVDMRLPEQAGTSGSVRWEDSALATSELGLRFGARAAWRGLSPYASMSFAQESGSHDETIYDLGFETVRVTDEGDRAFGRFAAGMEWSVGRFGLYGEVEGRVGDMEGVGGRVGMKFRF